MNGNGLQWIETGSESHVGLVRSVNQDRYAEFEDGRGNRLLVVADGMGGHRGGETASRLAVEVMGEIFERSKDSLEQTIRSAVEKANGRIYECAGADPDLAGMGTTVVGLALGEAGEAWVVHVGDSRLYLLRGGRLRALTEDHSLVAEMHRQGFITAEEAQVHPRRNELTRSVGVAAGVDVEISRIAMRPGDRFLLCSDGLCGYVGDDEIRQVLESEQPLAAARTLVDRANAQGGYDNVTVQVVAIAEDAPLEGDGAAESGEPLPATGRESTDLPDPARATRGISRLALTGSVLAGLFAAAAALWVLLRG
jgi:protein phosphatase